MNLIYITLDGGDQQAYREVEVYDLVAQQALPPHAYFWMEGMSEWHPICELPPRKVSSFVPPRRMVGPDSGLKQPVRSSPVAPEPPASIDAEPEISMTSAQAGHTVAAPVPVQEQVLFAMPVPDAKPGQAAAVPVLAPEPVAVVASTPVSVHLAKPPVRAADLLLEKPDANEISEERESKPFYFRTNPVPLTICLQVLMVGSIGASCVFIYECLDKIYGWSRSSTLNSAVDLLAANSPLTGQQTGVSSADGVFLLQSIGGLFCIHLLVEILFFFWIFYANKNSRAFATNIRFTPGWAVADFFIPVVNLFRPYQIIQEIWKVSENPRSWNGRRDSIFVGFWFLVRLSVLFLPLLFLSTTYSDSEDASIRMMGTVINLATIETDILFVDLTTLILVSVVTWRQAQWVRREA